MKLVEALRMALRGLATNKLRSGLTMLGIIIGIFAVITLVSIGNGVRQQFTDSVQSLGSNLLLVTPGARKQDGINLGQGTAVDLTSEDAKVIAQQAPSVQAVAPIFNTRVTATYLSRNVVTGVNGITPEFAAVHDWVVDQGRFISQEDVDSVSKVVVIGSGVEKDLFQNVAGGMLGKTIKINRQIYTVVGVMKSKGGSGFFNQDDQIGIPLTTAQRRLFRGNITSLSQIEVKAVSQDKMNEAQLEVASILRQRHHLPVSRPDDFTIQSQEDLLNFVGGFTTIMTVFLGAIASISLLVGGIGIMNIMLVSVTERTREIGVRKAVGAKRRDIMIQFVVEAVTLCGIGGLGGIGLGVGVSWLLRNVAINGLSLAPLIAANSVALALGVSVAIGLFFGIYPARRASRLNPIDALRYE